MWESMFILLNPKTFEMGFCQTVFHGSREASIGIKQFSLIVDGNGNDQTYSLRGNVPPEEQRIPWGTKNIFKSFTMWPKHEECLVFV